MKIKIDDNKTVFFVVLLVKYKKATDLPHVKKEITDLYLKTQKTAKNVPEAIQITVDEVKQREGFDSILHSSAALLTPKLFID